MFEESAATIDEWINLARQNCAAAAVLLNAKQTVSAWNHAGFSVECAMKAAIMRQEKFNRWPSKDLRPDLYSHDLTSLLEKAGLKRRLLIKEPVAHRLATVLQWGRNHSYYPKAMPLRVARDMYEAACGSDGVNSWLMKRFRLGT